MSEHHKFKVRCRGVIMHEGKLLVVKHHHDHAHHALPGGHLEYGEGIEECAKREIKEELGVEPVLGRLLYINTFIEKGSTTQSVEFFFEVRNASDYLVLNGDGSHAHELVDIVWADADTKLNIMPERIKQDLSVGEVGGDGIRFVAEL